MNIYSRNKMHVEQSQACYLLCNKKGEIKHIHILLYLHKENTGRINTKNNKYCYPRSKSSGEGKEGTGIYLRIPLYLVLTFES